MQTQVVEYLIEGKVFKGYWAFPTNEKQEKRPAVLVAHAWMGQDQFAREKAEALAKLGYIGFAADLYGEGKTASNSEEAQTLMLPLFEDRALLQKRMQAALEFVRQHERVDKHKIGAIGFCFGGLTVIELVRSGADIKGAVSFHGVLGSKMESIQAKCVPIASTVKSSLLILHGANDPLVSQEDILNMQKDLDSVQVDWQMNIYSQTSHAFTNPQAHDHEHGLVFQSRSSQRAWEALRCFFTECFK